MNQLEVRDICFSYDEKTPVLDHVSFEADGSGILCIAGASGAGKTTLLKIISGLLVEDSGTVYLDGEDLKQTVANKRSISYIFQNSFLYPNMTVYQNVMMGIKTAKMPLEEKDARVKTLLQQFRLSRFINLKPKQLSEGQRQRVALAKCMASRDRLYLLDEPMSHMDEKAKAVMTGLLRQLQQEKQVPFLCVCHDVHLMRQLSDRILVMHEGRILQQGTYRQLTEAPCHILVLQYLDVALECSTGRVVGGRLLTEDGRLLAADVPLPDQEVQIAVPTENIGAYHLFDTQGNHLLHCATYK